MVAQVRLTVFPPAPLLPEAVFIQCSGLDPAKDVELVLATAAVFTTPVRADGTVDIGYNVPFGAAQLALQDINTVAASANSIKELGPFLCFIRTGLGDSLGLRFKGQK